MTETLPNTNTEQERIIGPLTERDQQLHEQLITDDTEILGESLHLRRTVARVSHETTNSIHETYVKVRDVASTPRNTFFKLLRDRNELRIEKLEAKIASDPESPRFKRDREWISMYKARQAHWQGKMNKISQKSTMRSEKLSQKIDTRKDNYQIQIDSYVHAKVEKMRKKEMQRRQKELGIGKLQYKNQAEYFRSLPSEIKEKITREAIMAVRNRNIAKGKLDEEYLPDISNTTRSIDNYERIIR